MAQFLLSRDLIGDIRFITGDYKADGYFIDIGIPEDYGKANIDLAPKLFDISKINKSWTLFLDRDGVINKEISDGYVRTIKDFDFYPGALEAINIFRNFFGKIVIITNQRGIGKKSLSICASSPDCGRCTAWCCSSQG